MFPDLVSSSPPDQASIGGEPPTLKEVEAVWLSLLLLTYHEPYMARPRPKTK